jgi:hypothetical protein
LASRFHHELVGIPGSGFPASETSIPAAKTSRRKKPVVLNNERSESSRSLRYYRDRNEVLVRREVAFRMELS